MGVNIYYLLLFICKGLTSKEEEEHNKNLEEYVRN